MVSLTDEQRMVLRTVRDLAESEFADQAGTWDGELPWENAKALAERGLYGINFDERYGGGGLTELEAMMLIETVGRVCPDTGYLLNTQLMLAPRAIEMFGSEALKERYLPPVVAGEDALQVAISEPHAGSDVGAMNTRLEEDDGDLYLSGEKIWVSDVPESSAAVVWTRFPDDSLGSVVMDFDADGVDVNEHYTNMAGHHQTHFFMDDVHIPEENVLTRGAEGFKEQLRALNWERLGNAAMTNGMVAYAIDAALAYAKGREQFGRPIAAFQGIEWKLAEMATEFEASRALAYQAAERGVANDRVPHRLDASVATLFSAQMAERVVSEALQVHGATGYQREHPLEYLYRFVRGWRIGAGTDEIQKNQIADAIKREGVPTLLEF
ncbi:acyl-CoA dehydrogenase family protein [Halomarina halobia]|uniref:Acyl-CoA dehydrogenase family protein n=1 Tax=Halomarina halobia TaxID=3033386 RepID=A0ABD6ADW8_9EURY|nr:acyl-CoA dehydrogenase family protein [Halomarina sp. PSR21]